MEMETDHDSDESTPLLLSKAIHSPLVAPNVQEDRLKADGDRSRKISESTDVASRSRNKNLISNKAAFMHIVKGLIGTGILGLPHAFSNAGILLSPILVLVIAILCTWTAYIMVLSSNALCKRLGLKALDYAETVHFSALPYSERGARWLKMLTNIFLTVTQFGFCCVYVVFLSDHIVQVVKACGIEFGHGWDENEQERIVAACLFVPLMLATFIKNLGHLSLFSSLANILTAISFVVIYYFTISHMNLPKSEGFAGPLSNLPLAAPVSDWPLFLGTAIYAIEGIGVILPVQNRMRTPSHFGQVLVSGFAVVTVVYIITGQLGYMCFGDNSRGSVTLNLPTEGSHEWLYAIVKLLLIVVIFCTYLIQFYVPLTFLEPPVERYFGRPYVSYILRAVIVLITCALAIAIPDLGDFISLVGSLGGSTLLFIFPIVAYQLTFRQPASDDQDRPGFLVSALSVVVLIIGAIAFVLGTYSALEDIISPSNSTKPTTAPS